MSTDVARARRIAAPSSCTPACCGFWPVAICACTCVLTASHAASMKSTEGPPPQTPVISVMSSHTNVRSACVTGGSPATPALPATPNKQRQNDLLSSYPCQSTPCLRCKCETLHAICDVLVKLMQRSGIWYCTCQQLLKRCTHWAWLQLGFEPLTGLAQAGLQRCSGSTYGGDAAAQNAHTLQRVCGWVARIQLQLQCGLQQLLPHLQQAIAMHWTCCCLHSTGQRPMFRSGCHPNKLRVET